MTLVIGTINNVPVVFERENCSQELAEMGRQICIVLIGDSKVPDGGFLKIVNDDEKRTQNTMCPDDVKHLVDAHAPLVEAFSSLCYNFTFMNKIIQTAGEVMSAMAKPQEDSNVARN